MSRFNGAGIPAIVFAACFAVGSPPARLPAAETNDIVLADFEGESYAPWKTTLVAFGDAPRRVTPPLPGMRGRGLASSAADGVKDAPLRGSLESPEFPIERDYINFLISGGNHAFRAAISLWVEGRVVRTSSGDDTDQLAWATWDVREFRGRRAWIGIYDQCIEDEHGYVRVDEIGLSDDPRARSGGDVLAAVAQVRREAVDAIRRNAPRAAADPWRPVYHYAPPAQRMNDPNGPAWSNGWRSRACGERHFNCTSGAPRRLGGGDFR